jgi:hypothetical protein
MEIAVIVVYALILALVAPFVIPPSDHYGKLVPAGIALVAGCVIWLVLTWLGLNYQEAWIWFAVMLSMPAAAWFGSGALDRIRKKQELERLEQIRLGGKA